MNWQASILYALYGLSGLVLLLWIYNLILAVKGKKESVAVRRLMFSLALVAVVLNIVRSAALYGATMIIANLIALVCILVAFLRAERKQVTEA